MHGTIDGSAFPAGLTSALLVSGLVYARGWRRARRLAPAEWHDHDRLAAAFPSPSSRRAGLFILGLSALWLAVASPLGAIAHDLLSMHMLQHVIVGAIAPPLIWLSEPVLPVLLGLPRWLAPRTHAVFANGALGSLGRLLTHPFTAWFAAT
jgi:cytochrome c oxidase assembly factor CtaG